MLGDPGNRKKSRIIPAGAPPWMATFADLSTLLLSFFVLLLSFSEMNVEKYKEVAGSLRNAFGVQQIHVATDTPKGTSFVMREFSPGRPDPTPIERIEQKTQSRPQPYLKVPQDGAPIDIRSRASDYGPPADRRALQQAKENLDRIQAILADEIDRGLVEVERRGTRITIRIRERGSFPSGSARLIEPFTPVIRKIGEAINLTKGKVIIAGYTDNVPISNSDFRSNWELSTARALTLLHRLTVLADIDSTRITVEGHGDNDPVVPNDSALNRARNRRVEVTLVHGGSVQASRSVEEFLQQPEGGPSSE